jgi:calcineurin-like phosphoesterase family protein
MSTKVFFISDLHLGHKKIIEFSALLRECKSVESHDEWIIKQWNSVVTERDVVYVLGDIAFSKDGLAKAERLTGIKKMVFGNHDRFKIAEYEAVGFSVIGGIVKYKEFWLTHAPIHPDELRGKRNIHGHVHHRSIDDDRYINVCVENVGGVPIFLDDVRKKFL